MPYKTKAIAVGGRNGHVHTEDNLLSTRLALRKTMGGKEDATNPEQLFAAGYAACFGNAVLHVARQQKIALKDADVEIDAEVGHPQRRRGPSHRRKAGANSPPGVSVFQRHTR